MPLPRYPNDVTALESLGYPPCSLSSDEGLPPATPMNRMTGSHSHEWRPPSSEFENASRSASEPIADRGPGALGSGARVLEPD